MLQVYIVFGVRSKNDVCKLNFTCSTLYISRHTGYRYRIQGVLKYIEKLTSASFCMEIKMNAMLRPLQIDVAVACVL